MATDFFKTESRSPRGFLPRPLLRAGESIAPPPCPQKNSGGAHHFRFRFLDLCIKFGKIISKVCEGLNSGARQDKETQKRLFVLSCSAARTRTWNHLLTRNPMFSQRRGLYHRHLRCGAFPRPSLRRRRVLPKDSL